jgi:hypothetical protein
MEEVIISLKSAQNKSNDPYALDKSKSAYHDTLINFVSASILM